MSAEDAAHRRCCGNQQQTNHCCGHKPNGIVLAAARANAEYLEALKESLSPIQNKKVCFNPGNRHATKAQNRELLRREGRVVPTGGGWCGTSGCPHKIWLHLHHLIRTRGLCGLSRQRPRWPT